MKMRAGSGIVCPECKNQMGSLAHFCNKCGAILPPPVKPVDPEEQAEVDAECNLEDENNFGLCGKMGHLMQAAIVNAKFCAVCGAKFKFVE